MNTEDLDYILPTHKSYAVSKIENNLDSKSIEYREQFAKSVSIECKSQNLIEYQNELIQVLFDLKIELATIGLMSLGENWVRNAIKQKIKLDNKITQFKNEIRTSEEWISKENGSIGNRGRNGKEVNFNKIVFHYTEKGKKGKPIKIDSLGLINEYLDLLHNKIKPEITKSKMGAKEKAFNKLCNKCVMNIYHIIKEDNQFKSDGLISTKLETSISNLLISINVNYHEETVKNTLRRKLKSKNQ